MAETPTNFRIDVPQFEAAMIVRLVDEFYAKVRRDDMIGPIFNQAIGEHWSEHLGKMYEFWATVVGGAATYKGNPMQSHLELPPLSREHFARWLELWKQTAREECPAHIAEIFIERAEFIAERLLGAISLYHAHASKDSATH
jgi:hemoglobin